MKKTKILLMTFLVMIFSIFLVACANPYKKALEKVNVKGLDSVVDTVTLPIIIDGKYTVTWTIPENEVCFIEDNFLKLKNGRPDEDFSIVLTAKIDKFTKNFQVKVLKKQATPTPDPNESIVENIINNFSLQETYHVDEKIENLITEKDGATITWTEENSTPILKIDGTTAELLDKTITEEVATKLKVVVKKGEKSTEKIFNIKFKKDLSNEDIVNRVLASLTLNREYTADEKIENLIKEKDGAAITWTEENATPILKIDGTSAELLDKNISANATTKIKALVKKDDVTKEKIFDITFLPLSKTLNVKDALNEADGTKMHIEGIIVSNFNYVVILTDEDMGGYIQIKQKYNATPKDPFKDFIVGDKITVKNIVKTVKNNFHFVEGVPAIPEKTGHVDLTEPVVDLNVDFANEYSAKNQWRLIKASHLEFQALNKSNPKHITVSARLLTHDIVLQLVGDLKNDTSFFDALAVGDMFDIQNIRLTANFKGEKQILLGRADAVSLTQLTDEEKLKNEKNKLTLPANVTEAETLTLNKKGIKFTDVEISWESDKEAVINPLTGVVTATATEEVVRLKATLKLNGNTLVKEFEITVAKHIKTEQEIFDSIVLGFAALEDAEHVKTKIELILNIDDIAITYEVTPQNAGKIDANFFIANSILQNDTIATLTAKYTYNGAVKTKEFTITVLKTTLTEDQIIELAKNDLTLPTEIKVNRSLVLPKKALDFDITWEETTSPQKFDFTTSKLIDTNIDNEVLVNFKAKFVVGSTNVEKDFTVKFLPIKYYDVKFDLNGGTTANPIVDLKVKEGDFAIKPAEEVIPGATQGDFLFWTKDKTAVEPEEFEFDKTPINENLILYAVFRKIYTAKEAKKLQKGSMALVEGVVIGVSNDTHSFILADKTGAIAIRIKKGDALPKLKQLVRVYGLREDYQDKGKTILIKQVIYDKDSEFKLELKEENQEIADIITIAIKKQLDFQANNFQFGKLTFKHDKVKQNTNEYTFNTDDDFELTVALNYYKGIFMSDEAKARIQAIFSDSAKFGVYEATVLISESLKVKKVYLFDETKLVLKSALSEEDDVNAVLESLKLDKEYLCDAEIDVKTKSGDVEISWLEKTATPLLTQTPGSNSVIFKLTNQDITEDKEVTLEATLKKGAVIKTKTFNVKFLKKGQAVVPESSIFNFTKNKNNSSLNTEASVMDFFNEMKEQGDGVESVSNVQKVYKGAGNGGNYSNDPKFLKMGTSSADGSFTIKFKHNIAKVIVNMGLFGKKDKNVEVKINSGSSQKPKVEFKDFSFEIAGDTDTISFVTSKRVLIKSITIIYK